MDSDSIISEAVEAFDAIGQRWIDDATTPRASDVPDVVYHYTNAAGLQGILRSNAIWLTDYRFLNDSTEMAAGRSMVNEFINIDARSPSIPDQFYSDLDYFNQIVSTHVGHVFSLSEPSDDLSQWRGYADDGMGFTIGFDGQDLHSGASAYNFSKVDYDAARQRKTLGLALKEIELELTKRASAHPDQADKLATEAARTFDWLSENRAQVAKHHSFIAEKEWRIIRWTKEDIDGRDVRVSGNRLVPYLPLKIGSGAKLPIRRIGVGPGHSGPEVRAAVEALAKKCGYEVDVYNADSPFRRF